MALQTAATAKAVTDGNKPANDYETLTMNIIDTKISLVRGDQYHAEYSLDMEKRNNIPMIKQADDTLLSVDDILTAIRAFGYNASAAINGNFIELRVVWE